MHQQPLDFTARRLATRKAPVRRVIELGSLDINGSPRHLFDDGVDYVGVDLQSGPGVDVVADAATVGLEPADVVLCLEVFEHATNPEAIIRNARVLLRGGLFVARARWTRGRRTRPSTSGRYDRGSTTATSPRRDGRVAVRRLALGAGGAAPGPRRPVRLGDQGVTDRLWVVIPTRDDHPELLAALVDGCGVPRERIVLVNTGDHPVSRYRTRVVTDRGQVNIQRWWNRGIDYAEAMGATHVAVLNDDVRLAPARWRG